ncbi:hypothetical protein GW17_00036517 [Ensete ventricosum]|nr:hypothetical protein GW17_00036517 [Ensete ventricosum]
MACHALAPCHCSRTSSVRLGHILRDDKGHDADRIDGPSSWRLAMAAEGNMSLPPRPPANRLLPRRSQTRADSDLARSGNNDGRSVSEAATTNAITGGDLLLVHCGLCLFFTSTTRNSTGSFVHGLQAVAAKSSSPQVIMIAHTRLGDAYAEADVSVVYGGPPERPYHDVSFSVLLIIELTSVSPTGTQTYRYARRSYPYPLTSWLAADEPSARSSAGCSPPARQTSVCAMPDQGSRTRCSGSLPWRPLQLEPPAARWMLQRAWKRAANAGLQSPFIEVLVDDDELFPTRWVISANAMQLLVSFQRTKGGQTT